MAENSSSLRVCEELHKYGILDDHFLPHAEIEANNVLLESEDETQKIEEEFEISVSKLWKKIPNSINEDETITLFSTKVTIGGDNGFPDRIIYFLSFNEFKKNFDFKKNPISLPIQIEKSNTVILNSKEFNYYVQLHLHLDAIRNVSTATRIGCFEHFKKISENVPANFVYLQYFPNVSIDDLTKSHEDYGISNYRDIQTLNDLSTRLIWITKDHKRLLWYFDGILEKTPNSTMKTKIIKKDNNSNDIKPSNENNSNDNTTDANNTNENNSNEKQSSNEINSSSENNTNENNTNENNTNDNNFHEKQASSENKSNDNNSNENNSNEKQSSNGNNSNDNNSDEKQVSSHNKSNDNNSNEIISPNENNLNDFQSSNEIKSSNESRILDTNENSVNTEEIKQNDNSDQDKNISIEKETEEEEDEVNVTFAEHYQQQYGIPISEIDMNQLLIGIVRVIKTKNFTAKKPENYWKQKLKEKSTKLSALPQFCSIFPLTASEFQAIQLLPIVLWELNQYSLVQEFKEECTLCYLPKLEDCSLGKKLLIASCCSTSVYDLSNEEVFDLLLQMAFTSPSANIHFNYELLETLGDSFLKFCVSDYLHTSNPIQHEGILTLLRTKIIANSNLFKLAKERNIHKFVAASPTIECLNSSLKKIRIPFKRFADIVEALIGVFVITIGREGSQEFLNWLGIRCFTAEETKKLFPTNLSFLKKTYGNNNNIICNEDDVEKINSDDQNVSDSGNDNDEINTKIPAVFLYDIERLQKRLCYYFNHIELLNEARTHASFKKAKKSFQRLEFLGDAVLDFCVSLFFFEKYCQSISPYTLTTLRSSTVSNDTFAKALIDFRLHHFILHDSRFIAQQLVEYEKHVNKLEKCGSEVDRFLNKLSYRTPKIGADVFESLVGAVYLDCKRDTRVVWKIFYPLLANHFNSISINTIKLHPIVILYQLQSKDIRVTSKMDVRKEKGTHIFRYTYYINKEELASAFAKNKATSSTNAAIQALVKLFDIVMAVFS